MAEAVTDSRILNLPHTQKVKVRIANQAGEGRAGMVLSVHPEIRASFLRDRCQGEWGGEVRLLVRGWAHESPQRGVDWVDLDCGSSLVKDLGVDQNNVVHLVATTSHHFTFLFSPDEVDEIPDLVHLADDVVLVVGGN